MQIDWTPLINAAIKAAADQMPMVVGAIIVAVGGAAGAIGHRIGLYKPVPCKPDEKQS